MQYEICTSFLCSALVRLARVDDPHLMSGFDEYANWESYSNRSSYARSLPAVPLNCPTPMGVKGELTTKHNFNEIIFFTKIA